MEGRLLRRLAVAVVLLVPVRGLASEVDVGGNWQINIHCDLVLEATSFISIAEDSASGAFTATTPDCGTVEVSGLVVPVSSCPTVPEPRTGLVVGDDFRVPVDSFFTVDATPVTAFTFPFYDCPTGLIRTEIQYLGTIQHDLDGHVSGIHGTLSNRALQVYRPDGTRCVDIADTIDCGIFMRRNDVVVGSNVRVSPRDEATLTFETVLVPGIATVVPRTEAAAEIPPEVTIVAGGGLGAPTFYDLGTTAVVDGVVTSCIGYRDANQDGLVDGIGVPETRLGLLHAERGVFVDRTASRDTVANVVCAETRTLSQMTLGLLPTVTSTATTTSTTVTITTSTTTTTLACGSDGEGRPCAAIRCCLEAAQALFEADEQSPRRLRRRIEQELRLLDRAAASPICCRRQRRRAFRDIDRALRRRAAREAGLIRDLAATVCSATPIRRDVMRSCP